MWKAYRKRRIWILICIRKQNIRRTMSLGGEAASWKQPPHLAAHWPQSHHWDFQNADEMAFAKILKTTIKMYKWRVMFPYREVCVSLFSSYGNTQRIPCNFIPHYLMFLLSMFRVNRPFLGYPTPKGHTWGLPKSPSLTSLEGISGERSCTCYKESTQNVKYWV